MEVKRIDWYLIFCFLFIFFAVELFCLYYYVYHVDKCYRDPLEYYVQKTKWEYGGEFKVYGNIQLMNGKVIHLLSFGEGGRNLTTEIIQKEVYKEVININLSDFLIKN